ncbi:arylsulfatase [Microlunatus sp. GCM10028923]
MTDNQTRRPNVVIILTDDLGYSDIGCYGSEIETPHLDALAAAGVRMSQFYNTARCSPSRASLLTGLHPHQTGIGVLTRNDGPGGYPGTLSQECATLAEILGSQGYATAMSGKWHLTGQIREPDETWPTRRGFDHHYGIVAGAASYYDPATLTEDEQPAEAGDDYYLTTELGERAAGYVHDHHAAEPEQPLFLYLALTAPHWPLHAPEDVVERYHERYRAGWDRLREERHARQQESGLINADWPLSERDAEVPAWADTADQDWQARRMAVYAAQVELADAAIGRVVSALRDTGRLDDTMIIFLSDNGGCAEEMPPGYADELPARPIHTPLNSPAGVRVRTGNAPEIVPGGADTYTSYGKPWANLSNTPFREYKHWVHEGGIATPLIAHWPAGLSGGVTVHDPYQLPDVLATVLEATGAEYPERRDDHPVPPAEGTSMLPSWRGGAVDDHELFWEHEGNSAARRGRWKLVRKHDRPWELYDLDADRTELTDVAADHPDLVQELITAYQAWADRCGVLPRDQVLATHDDPGPSGRTHLVVNSYRSARVAASVDGDAR